MIRNADRRELLGIHPATSLPAGTADELDAELPTYVTRDVDADVRDALRAASRPGSAGGFLLLCGAAATGRTRCAYEAARACLSDWKLYIPGDAAEPVEQVDSGADFGRTVIRLDELHRFVVEGGRWGRHGEARWSPDTPRPAPGRPSTWATSARPATTRPAPTPHGGFHGAYRTRHRAPGGGTE
ncbi:hypothetical protein ACLQ18_16895 [Streptomyces sp. DT193]|uniref:hypothetical protein n=1 Tax=Streptomyces sp. DT193 TaxID=3393418 RepID=UPI003CED185B